MKAQLRKIIDIIIYFFTPEDSATSIHRGIISFDISPDRMGIGSAKALFWVMNAMIVVVLISFL